MLQLADERQRVADRRQQDVAPGLVRLGLKGEADVVVALAYVAAEQVDGLFVAAERGPHVLGRVRLGPLAAAPAHVGGGAQRGGQVEVARDLAQRVTPHVAVVAGEGPVAEDGVREQVRGGHGHFQPGLGECFPERRDRPFAIGFDGEQVVIVESDTVGPQLGQTVHALDGIEGRPGGIPERIARLPADRPQTERESIVRGWLVHDSMLPWRSVVHKHLFTSARLTTLRDHAPR